MPFETHGDATRERQRSGLKQKKKNFQLVTLHNERRRTRHPSAARHPEFSLSLVLSPSRDAFQRSARCCEGQAWWCNFSIPNGEKFEKKRITKDRFLSGLPPVSSSRPKEEFLCIIGRRQDMAGYVYTISLSRKRVDLSMCCCEKICVIDLLLCFVNARVSFVSRSTVGVRLRLENYKNPLES